MADILLDHKHIGALGARVDCADPFAASLPLVREGHQQESMMSTSFFAKNVPPFERILRVVIALAAVVAALMLLPAPWSYVAAAGSLGFSLTGFIGYCPACAMIGRRL